MFNLNIQVRELDFNIWSGYEQSASVSQIENKVARVCIKVQLGRSKGN